MKSFIQKNKKDIINISLLLLISFIIMIPMLFTEYHSGHDTQYHIINVKEYTKQIDKNFLFPSKIVGEIGNDFGYGTPLFYPPLSHTTVSYLNYFTGNIFFSFKMVHFLVLFASGLTMYFFSKKLSKNDKIGFLSAIIYMLFPYHLSSIYVRDALAECFLYPFLPLILNGIYELYNGNKKKFYPLFIIGYMGGFLSHVTMMLYFTIFIAVYMLINYKKTFTKEIIWPFLKATIVTILLICPTLVIMAEQKFLGNYRVFLSGVMVEGTQGNGLILYDYINYHGKLFSNAAKFYLDMVATILLIVTLVKFRKMEKDKFYKTILFFLLLSIWLSTSLFPWDIFPKSLRMMQFPWRFEQFVAFGFALLAPLCCKNVSLKRQNYLYVLALPIFIFSFTCTSRANDSIVSLDNLWIEGGMGWQEEYLPVNTYEHHDYFDKRGHDVLVTSGNAKITNTKEDMPKVTFEITDIDGNVVVELPRLYYVGYTLKDEQGNKISVTENEMGFASAIISAKGTYTLDYTGTTIDNIAKWISIITFLGCLGYVGWIWKHGKN